MGAFYFFSDEQLRKLKLADLLKLAGYYHVNFNKKKPNVEHIISDILKAQKTHSFVYSSGAGVSEPAPTGVSVRIQRIRDQNREER